MVSFIRPLISRSVEPAKYSPDCCHPWSSVIQPTVRFIAWPLSNALISLKPPHLLQQREEAAATFA
tara:strand:+ start:331 stop:528 length:198 start_codon:yes stop_codon:yes gene_type:complete